MLPRHWPDDGPPLRIAYRYSGAGRGGRSARRVVIARRLSRMTCPSRSASACTTNVLPKDDRVAALSVLRSAGLEPKPTQTYSA
ncbi:MAG: hypothetical protein QOC62_4762 [Mycobacterium sp.]|jgi:hypothetical protein|nr:hypothetical protein [Mycobacterium sp.]